MRDPLADSYSNRDSDTYTHAYSNAHSNTYPDGNPHADFYTEVFAHTEASTYTGPAPVNRSANWNRWGEEPASFSPCASASDWVAHCLP